MELGKLIIDIDVLELAADTQAEISGISYDSRNTEQGNLFVAVEGYQSDGHKYISAALEKGAAAVVCQRKPDIDIPYILVADSRKALAQVSAEWFGRPADKMQMIGVTGTNGKTTTTMLIKHFLELLEHDKVGLIGTNQNMIAQRVLHTERTTPESYELQKLFREMADSGCSHVVMEVSSHSLELDRVYGIGFKVGIFTNLTQDHLDFHITMENYACAKAKLFARCESCAVNIDDEWGAYMIEAAKQAGRPVLTYSAKDSSAGLYAKDIKLSASGIEFTAVDSVNNEESRVRLGIPGRFSVYNALSVLACGILLGESVGRCAEALAVAKGVMGRVEVVPVEGDYTMLIDYAHTPDALDNVLRSMKEVSEGRVVVLFGCGGDRDRTKRPIMGRIASELADFVVITSDNPRTENPSDIIDEIMSGVPENGAPHVVIEDREEAIRWIMDNHKPGDLVILAGKGHETYQIVGTSKRHMDEREIVAGHLKNTKK